MMPARFPCLLALVGVVALSAPILVVPGPDGEAVAQRRERRKPPETKKVKAVREWAFKRLTQAQEALAAEDYATTLAKLEEMKRSSRLNEHEIALMHQTYAYYYSEKEDFKGALREFEAAVATGGLPTAVELSVRYNIGQLYIMDEQYHKGIDTLNEWLTLVETPTPDAYILLANAWVQLEDYERAVPYAKQAVDMSVNKPREGWMKMLLSLYFQLERYPRAEGVLERLVRLWPKKQYWMQLSLVYATNEKEHEALSALEVAYGEGYLTESRELVRLAQMYLFHEIPYRAANVLEKGFRDERIEETEDNYELLANSWIRAQELEQALPPLGSAANLSEDGNLYMRIGQIHVEAEKWKNAERALSTAIQKGDLDRPGLANLLLGIAQFNSGKLTAAKRSFTRAAKYDRYKKQGRQWLRHIAQQA